MSPDSIPRLARGTRLQPDRARGGWVLLAPERMLIVDDIAHAVLQLCDGRPVRDVCAVLAAQFDARPDVIQADVLALLRQLSDKGYLHHD